VAVKAGLEEADIQAVVLQGFNTGTSWQTYSTRSDCAKP
jgi:hypothetical protein